MQDTEKLALKYNVNQTSVSNKFDRILRTLIGFSLVSKVYNNKIDELFQVFHIRPKCDKISNFNFRFLIKLSFYQTCYDYVSMYV